MTKLQQLKAHVAYWQVALRLQDWEIEVKLVKGSDLDHAQSRIERNVQHRTAQMKISDAHVDLPADLSDEERVVHELLHLYFWNDGQADTAEQSEEQGINMLARLLVKYCKDKPK